jgi:hypothetical protein
MGFPLMCVLVVILLVAGLVGLDLHSKAGAVEPGFFPKVPPDRFDRMKKFEMRSYKMLMVASWGLAAPAAIMIGVDYKWSPTIMTKIYTVFCYIAGVFWVVALGMIGVAAIGNSRAGLKRLAAYKVIRVRKPGEKTPASEKIKNTLAALVGLAILFGFTGLSGYATLSSIMFNLVCRECPGTLDNNYTQITRTKFFIPISTSYRVSYSYEIDGKKYSGQDMIDDAPTSLAINVLYVPDKPVKSHLQKQPFILSGVFFLVLGLVSVLVIVGILQKFFKTEIKPSENSDPNAPTAQP